MTRPAIPRNTFTSGCLSEELRERYDLRQWHQALRDGTNTIVIPQGGLIQRGGLPKRGRARRMVRRLQIASGMLTTPNGGTGTNLIDQDPNTECRTAASVSGSPFVVVQVDLGAAQSIVFADAVRYSCSTSQADAAFVAQVSTDGSTWSQLGTAFNIRSSARTRRFATAPGSAVSARYLRLVVTGAPSIGTVGLGELRIWTEIARRTEIKKFVHTFDRTQAYTMWATHHNVDVYLGGVWVAAVPVPHRTDQLAVTTRASARDTLLLWNADVQPHTLFRQGSHAEWDSYSQTFTNVPNSTAATAFGSAQDEVQQIDIAGIGSSDSFTLEAEDQLTVPIAVSGGASAIAAAVKAALEALPAIDAGLVVTAQTSAGAGATINVSITVRFAGGTNTGRSWAPLFVDVLATDTATVTISTAQDGRAASGALMSAQTGWPRCGAFWLGRLIVGGFKQAPQTYLGSVVNDFFNFAISSTVQPDDAINDTLDSDEVAAIYHIFAGRHLMLLTENSEWYMTDRAIDATKDRNLVQATRYGAKPGIEPVMVDGGVQFVQGDGTAVLDLLYDLTQDNYLANDISLLGSHLLNDVTDLAYRRRRVRTDANQIFAANADGTAACLSYLRAEKVVAMTPLATRGKIRGIAVDGARGVMMAVERVPASGFADTWLEQLDTTAYLDNCEDVATTPGSAVLSVPARFEGLDVWVIADGLELGPYTVASGLVTLPRAPDGATVTVGFFFDIRVETLPYYAQRQDGTMDMSPHRIFGVTASVLNTGSLAVAANDGTAAAIGLRTFDAPNLDISSILNPVSGEFRLDGIEGKKRGPTAVVTRPRPGPFTLAALYLEAA